MAMNPRQGSGATDPGETMTANTNRGGENEGAAQPPKAPCSSEPTPALREDILPTWASESHRATKVRLGVAKPPTSTCLLSHKGRGEAIMAERADASAGLACPSSSPPLACLWGTPGRGDWKMGP